MTQRVDIWTAGATMGAETQLAKAEDAAHASGDYGLMVLGVRKDTAAALAGTDGDYIPLIVDASGRLHVAPLPANSGTDIGDVTVNNAADAGVYVRPGTSEIFPVRGTAFRSASNQLTRPGDTNAYHAGDVVVGLLTFASVGRANAAGSYIINPRLISSVAPAATGSFKLWLFNAAPTVAAEHAAFAPSDAEMATTCIGIIYFDRADKTANNTLYTQANFTPIYLKCGAATTSIYGVLTDAAGSSAANAETYDVILSGVQD
jgi:hypothetical protein